MKQKQQMLRILPKLILMLFLASRQVTTTEINNDIKVSIVRDPSCNRYSRQKAAYIVTFTALTVDGEYQLWRATRLYFELPKQFTISQGQQVSCEGILGVSSPQSTSCEVPAKNELYFSGKVPLGERTVQFKITEITNPKECSIISDIYFRFDNEGGQYSLSELKFQESYDISRLSSFKIDYVGEEGTRPQILTKANLRFTFKSPITIESGSGIALIVPSDSDRSQSSSSLTCTGEPPLASTLSCVFGFSRVGHYELRLMISQAFSHEIEPGVEISFEVHNFKLPKTSGSDPFSINIFKSLFNTYIYSVDYLEIYHHSIKDLKISFGEKEEYDISNSYSLVVNYQTTPGLYFHSDTCVFEFSVDSDNLSVREAWIKSEDQTVNGGKYLNMVRLVDKCGINSEERATLIINNAQLLYWREREIKINFSIWNKGDSLFIGKYKVQEATAVTFVDKFKTRYEENQISVDQSSHPKVFSHLQSIVENKKLHNIDLSEFSPSKASYDSFVKEQAKQLEVEPKEVECYVNRDGEIICRDLKNEKYPHKLHSFDVVRALRGNKDKDSEIPDCLKSVSPLELLLLERSGLKITSTSTSEVNQMIKVDEAEIYLPMGRIPRAGPPRIDPPTGEATRIKPATTKPATTRPLTVLSAFAESITEGPSSETESIRIKIYSDTSIPDNSFIRVFFPVSLDMSSNTVRCSVEGPTGTCRIITEKIRKGLIVSSLGHVGFNIPEITFSGVKKGQITTSSKLDLFVGKETENCGEIVIGKGSSLFNEPTTFRKAQFSSDILGDETTLELQWFSKKTYPPISPALLKQGEKVGFLVKDSLKCTSGFEFWRTAEKKFRVPLASRRCEKIDENDIQVRGMTWSRQSRRMIDFTLKFEGLRNPYCSYHLNLDFELAVLRLDEKIVETIHLSTNQRKRVLKKRALEIRAQGENISDANNKKSRKVTIRLEGVSISTKSDLKVTFPSITTWTPGISACSFSTGIGQQQCTRVGGGYDVSVQVNGVNFGDDSNWLYLEISGFQLPGSGPHSIRVVLVTSEENCEYAEGTASVTFDE